MSSDPPGGRASPIVRRGSWFLYLCTGVLATWLVAAFWNGGTLDTEAIVFFSQYTSDRPFLAKIFHPRANDFWTYQARELSYLFDYIDTMLYKHAVAPMAPALLVPPSSLVLPSAISLVFHAAVVRCGLNRGTGLLLLACFLSSFVFVSTMGVFYRSGKPILAATLLVWLFHLYDVNARRSPESLRGARPITRPGLVAFGLAVVVGLLDRQGAFYVLAATGVLLVHYALTRRLGDLVVATGAAGIAVQVYNLKLGPWAIHRLNGYWPDFHYQDVPITLIPSRLRAAMQMTAENVSLMFGGYAPGAVILALLLVFVVCRIARRRGDPPPTGNRGAALRLLSYLGLGCTAQVLMFALMIARHPVVFEWLDHRYWYYPLPFLAIVLFGVSVALKPVLDIASKRERRIVHALLGLMIIGNLASLPHFKRTMTGGPWFRPVYDQSVELKAFLRTGVMSPYLAENYKAFGLSAIQAGEGRREFPR